MTDYKNLKLIATSSPHIRAAENTRSIMLDVIIAMLPALAWAVWMFGFKALTLTAVSAAGCGFFEWGYRKLMKKPQSVGDLSAVVTGMLLAFVSPVIVPYWMILVGDFFAIVVVKQLFGGIGKIR
jgi:electron transport complex protein RnfD